MPLVRLLYLSKSTLMDGTRTQLEQLTDILNVAKEKNRRKNITGALAYDGEYFVQVLEGRRDDVWEVFQSIFNDKRHVDVTLTEFREVSERLFGNWYMALATRNQDTDILFDRFEREGNVGERGAKEMLHLLIKLAELGFDRVVLTPQKSVA
jgi:hypothetical protein